MSVSDRWFLLMLAVGIAASARDNDPVSRFLGGLVLFCVFVACALERTVEHLAQRPGRRERT